MAAASQLGVNLVERETEGTRADLGNDCLPLALRHRTMTPAASRAGGGNRVTAVPPCATATFAIPIRGDTWPVEGGGRGWLQV